MSKEIENLLQKTNRKLEKFQKPEKPLEINKELSLLDNLIISFTQEINFFLENKNSIRMLQEIAVFNDITKNSLLDFITSIDQKIKKTKEEEKLLHKYNLYRDLLEVYLSNIDSKFKIKTITKDLPNMNESFIPPIKLIFDISKEKQEGKKHSGKSFFGDVNTNEKLDKEMEKRIQAQKKTNKIKNIIDENEKDKIRTFDEEQEEARKTIENFWLEDENEEDYD